jgi:hypothetical protein
MSKNIAQLDTLRTAAFGSIGRTFTAIGAAVAFQQVLLCFTNTTNQDAYISNDGVNDKIFVPAGGFKLLDIRTNHRPVNQDDFCFVIGTQWYVRNLVDAASGNVYLEVLYTQP